HAPSIIAIAQNQMEDWGTVDYCMDGNGSPFEAWLVVEMSGTFWTTQAGASHPRKQGAKHRACVNWLKAFCNECLISSESAAIATRPEAPQASNPLPAASSDHAVSQLNELCQRHQWNIPDYEFYEEEADGFMCECQLSLPDGLMLGFGSGARKAIAKRNAAQQILQQVYSK
ncbi:MAG: double-stranded RNA binding motif domain-containing protein, partial [Cyanobacteria bacterium P01_F01_bin.42]